jgi:GNAT superfamily N-acetyltransferase
MIEEYRPEHYKAIRAFARKQPNFGYVREIVRWHTKTRLPGGCYVWREAGTVVAFCGVQYLNSDDAWLYGMRVDDRCKGQGVATRFTRALFRIVRASGRTWAGLNTLDHGRPAPVFRIAEKLGMKLEAIHATDPYWRLALRSRPVRPEKLRDIYRLYRARGERTLFQDRRGWVWYRLLPGRRRQVNQGGRCLLGTPVHFSRTRFKLRSGRIITSTTVNLLDRPRDIQAMMRCLLVRGVGSRSVTINYPAEWKTEMRRAARALIPNLKPGRNCWPTVWRIYGKHL